jgi:translation initiation factor 4G
MNVSNRRVRGILNKITPEKFEKLIADILNIIGQGSNVVFKGVIVLIFEKALDEPKYSSMYAQLCKRLAEHAPNLEPPDSKVKSMNSKYPNHEIH